MSTFNPDYEMEALDRWILKLAKTTGPLLSQSDFEDAHMKARLDNHLADLYENAWHSYNSLALQTPKDTSTGMSAFDDPKETPIPHIDEKGNLKILDAEDNESEASEALDKPIFDPASRYSDDYDYLPTSAKVPLYANEMTYNIHHQAALTNNIVRQVGTLTESLVGKMDAMMEAIMRLTNIVNTQSTTIASLERKISSNQHQNNSYMINHRTSRAPPANLKYNDNTHKPTIQNPPPPPRQQAPKPAEGKFYAAAAAKEAETPFQIATKSKKTKPPARFSNTFTATEREILVTTAESIATGDMDNKILQSINEILSGQFRFMFAKATARNTIILQIPTDANSSIALGYDTEIRLGLSTVGVHATEIKANSKMSKFIFDGIPSAIGLSPAGGCIEMAAYVIANYPEIELAQVPVWMCCPDILANKTHEAMVIAFKGTHTIDSLGRSSVVICNKFCRLRPYLIQNPTTQCYKCQRYRHHTDLCKEENPTCGHCAGVHLTKDHQCEQCNGGYKCTHTTLRCVNCPGEPHAAFDLSCKAKARIIAARREARPPPPPPQNEPMIIAS